MKEVKEVKGGEKNNEGNVDKPESDPKAPLPAPSTPPDAFKSDQGDQGVPQPKTPDHPPPQWQARPSAPVRLHEVEFLGWAKHIFE